MADKDINVSYQEAAFQLLEAVCRYGNFKTCQRSWI